MTASIVIILYNPDVEHVNQLIAMFNDDAQAVVQDKQWKVLLIDNSEVAVEPKLEGRYSYIHCGKNVGIARAQNIGLHKAFSEFSDYAFLLDQDSAFSPKLASELVTQFKLLSISEPVAAIGPCIHCEFAQQEVKGVFHKGKEISSTIKEVKQIIASGMLLSKEAFYAVGDKEQSLFIDGVDHEWCWRARGKGLKVYQSLTARMPHRQGDARVNVLGISFKQGTPIRLYYQFRNLLVLARRSYVPTYWKFRHITAIPLRYFVNRFFMPNGEQRAAFMRKGLLHGLKKKGGAFDE